MPVVLDLSRDIAGRYCAQMLALGGADVTRVAAAGGETEEVAALQAAGYPLAVLDRGKRVVHLSAQAPLRDQQLQSLLAGADAVVEDGGQEGLNHLGFAADVVERWAAHATRTRISEFGADGPRAGWAGSELVNLAAGGLLFLTGAWDRPPVQLAPFQAQFATGLFAAIATQAALFSGDQVSIDVSKQECVEALITPALTDYVYGGVIPAREGTVAGMVRIERAKDRWVYAGPAAPGNADYTTLSAFLEVPELAEPRFATQDARMEHWEEHQALIVPRLQERTASEWVNAAEQWRLTFGHVQTTTELLACPVLAERDYFARTELPGGPLTVPLAPYLVDGRRPDRLASPPEYGEPPGQ